MSATSTATAGAVVRPGDWMPATWMRLCVRRPRSMMKSSSNVGARTPVK